MSRVIADVDQFADGLLMGFTQFFTGAATIVGTFGFMLSVNVGYYICGSSHYSGIFSCGRFYSKKDL